MFVKNRFNLRLIVLLLLPIIIKIYLEIELKKIPSFSQNCFSYWYNDYYIIAMYR